MESNSLQALKFAVEDSSVKFITGYAGTIASSFMKEFPNLTQALNETIALDMAHIHSYLGKRALAIMKNAGLNQSALSFRNICDTGINAGLIIIVTDDINAEMSENKQDSRVYAELGKTLLLEPKSPSELYEMIYLGFDLSESLQMPILVRLTNALNDDSLKEELIRKKSVAIKMKRAKFDQSQWVLNPLNTEKIINLHLERYNKILSFVEKTDFNKVSGKIEGKGCIYSQALTEKEKRSLKKYGCVFSVGTFPLPIKKMQEFVSKSKSIDVIDSGESILTNEIKRASSNLKIRETQERDYKWNGLPITIKSKWLNYTPLFEIIKNQNPDVIVGDFGSYTLALESPIEYALHYGGAIASGVGAFLSGEKNVYVVIGDGGFSTGLNGLVEASRKKANLNIIVIENLGISKKEEINLDLEKLALGNGASYVKRISDKKLNKSIFEEMENHKGISVLFVDYSQSHQSLPKFTINQIKSKFKKMF